MKRNVIIGIFILLVINILIVILVINNSARGGDFISDKNNKYINQDNEPGVYNKDIILNDDMAKKVGDLILTNIYGQDITDKTKISVSKTDNGKQYLVCRALKDGSLGGDYNIIIDIKTGAVIKAWMGE